MSASDELLRRVAEAVRDACREVAYDRQGLAWHPTGNLALAVRSEMLKMKIDLDAIIARVKRESAPSAKIDTGPDPFAYRDEQQPAESAPADEREIVVRDADGRIVGRGYANAQQPRESAPADEGTLRLSDYWLCACCNLQWSRVGQPCGMCKQQPQPAESAPTSDILITKDILDAREQAGYLRGLRETHDKIHQAMCDGEVPLAMRKIRALIRKAGGES